jgi:hypothetical protein
VDQAALERLSSLSRKKQMTWTHEHNCAGASAAQHAIAGVTNSAVRNAVMLTLEWICLFWVGEMRLFRAWLGRGAVVAICLCMWLFGQSQAQGVSPTSVKSSHRAVAVTQAGDAVLRDDGRVIGFSNKTGEGKEPVFIEGLADIVDVVGESEDGLGPSWPRSSAYWIALRGDGMVLQWGGHCVDEGIYDCRFARARIVPGLRSVIAIASARGTHLAIDGDGHVWGWGLDHDGLITGQKGERDPSGRQIPRMIKSPIQIPVPVPLKAVTVGFPHSIGIDREGNVWLWGGEGQPEYQPERSEVSTHDNFIARKVLGIPPAQSAAADGRTFVVTDAGELWSWGITKLDAAPPNGTRVPHKVEGLCAVKSVSSGSAMAATVCKDGALYKMVFPSTPSISGDQSCETCSPITDEHWDREPLMKDVEVLHLAFFPSNAAVSMIDRSGAVYFGHFSGPRVFLPPGERFVGPVNIDPQGRK